MVLEGNLINDSLERLLGTPTGNWLTRIQWNWDAIVVI